MSGGGSTPNRSNGSHAVLALNPKMSSFPTDAWSEALLR